MSGGIGRLARWLWGHILVSMRRPGVRALQRRSIEWLPERMRAKARADLRRQNRFALRYGEAILRWSLTLMVASITLQLVYALVVYWSIRGVFTPPESALPPGS